MNKGRNISRFILILSFIGIAISESVTYVDTQNNLYLGVGLGTLIILIFIVIGIGICLLRFAFQYTELFCLIGFLIPSIVALIIYLAPKSDTDVKSKVLFQ